MTTSLRRPRRPAALLPAFAVLTGFHGCLSDGHGDENGSGHTLFVAHAGGNLVAYDIATGKALPGEIPGMTGPSDMQILANGILMVNLTDSNKILVVDARTRLEVDRIPSSALGETPLGIGHHKAAWSRTRERAVISNIGDVNDILTVIDYSDIGSIQRVATFDWRGAGLDSGKAASPHGCGLAKSSGKGYCNLTGPGIVVAVDIDAATPTFKLIRTQGTGGGYTSTHPRGRYVYSMQTAPREGKGGQACQVGQIAVIDATLDSLVKELPLFLTGPACADSISAGDQKTAGPGHILFTDDGAKAYVGMASGFGDPDGRSRVELVLDVADPANPKQLESAPIGASVSHHADILTGDQKIVFVANNQGASVTRIDAATGKATRTLTVNANPKAMASFGEEEGPSHQAGPTH